MTPRSLFSSIIVSAAFLTGCSAAGALNAVTPSGSFDRDKDIPYGDQSRQSMDIYRAQTPKSGAPTLVFVYGGAWSRGRKGMYKFVAEGFTKDGYDVVVPDYRLYPDATYPDMIVDTGAAVQKAATLFPGRPLVLIGHSAGAYNVLMSALAPEISGVEPCEQIAGVISLSGPTGAYPLTDEPYISIFPDRFEGSDAPINRSDRPAPPLLLINGSDDTTVGPENATRMAEKFNDAGLRAEAAIYPGMNHIDPVRVLSRHFDGNSTLKSDMQTFIDGLEMSPPFCE